MRLDDIDLLDLDRFTEGVPHEWFTYLRHHAPVYRHPEPDGPGFWVLTKHADVVAVGRDARTFSSEQDLGGVVGLADVEVRGDFNEGGRMMLTMDPPDHTRYRKLVNRGFTPRMIAQLEPHIREITGQVIDRAVGLGECDFVVDVASELPLQVIAELMGIPVEDRSKIFTWSNRMIGSFDPEYRVSEEAVNEARIEMFMYAHALGERRRSQPGEDIITKLLAADVDGDELSEMDFNLFFLLLAVAGNETTRNTMGHGMNAFIENPAQYAKLVGNPSLMPTAIEEMLRWASPVMYFRRNVIRDTEIGGEQIRSGDKVTIWYVSANRDEDVFDDPFFFDIERSPNEHVAFGGGGPHHCLGANLARMQLRVFWEEMVRRVPSVEPLGGPSRLRSNFVAGIKHLPVRLHPAARPVSVG
ncbi:MAG TPA: cytochrome P450 [Acidimicrobiales bacterium]